MATCIHGFDPGQCLICRTLDAAPSAEQSRRTTRAERRAGETGSGTRYSGPVEVVDGPRRSPTRRAGTHILAAVIVIILAVLAFWVVAGVVYALLRLVEILAVAIIAGGLGYRLGRARGHRDH